GMREYANAVRTAIRMNLAETIAGILGVALGGLTLGLGLVFPAVVAAVTRTVASVLTNVGLSMRAATFVAEALVFGGVEVGADLLSRVIGARAAGAPLVLGPVDAFV